MQRSYVCANVGNVRGYRRYVDMYTSAYQRHSPTVGLHAEGLALQSLSFYLVFEIHLSKLNNKKKNKNF